MNKVELIGRLTHDVEMRQTPNGVSLARFSIAVTRRFKNSNGEYDADFINCVAWRNQAENMAKFLRKGSLIGVEGRIETGSYQAQDGSTRYTTDVVCDSVQFLEPRSASADRGSFGSQPSQDFGGFGGGYGGAPSFPSQQSSNAFGGNPFGGAPSPDQNFGNSSPSFNNGPDFSSTINISDDDLPF